MSQLILSGLTGCRENLHDVNSTFQWPSTRTRTQLEPPFRFLYSGNLGGGRLHYQGKTYEFIIGGPGIGGIGGIGVSKIEVIGEVYNLNNLSEFPGAYAQARYGFVVDTESTGELCL
jgi:hypothetical protein